MTARIITITNQKGGAGKTTLAMHLAAGLAQQLDRPKVLIVDADRQGTATRWGTSAPDQTPFPATLCGLASAGGKVHREVQKYVDDYDYIVIDCPPAVDSPIPRSALLISDLALVPIVPSPPDLWAGVAIRDLIEELQDFNEDLQARLVVNMVQPNTKLAQEVISILGEFGIEMLATRLKMRTAYRQAAALGGTVYQLGSEARAAITETTAMTREVLNVLEGKAEGQSARELSEVRCG